MHDSLKASNNSKTKKKSNCLDDLYKISRKNSYLYSVYPDGKGPLADLIQSLETDVVEQNPKIRFD